MIIGNTKKKVYSVTAEIPVAANTASVEYSDLQNLLAGTTARNIYGVVRYSNDFVFPIVGTWQTNLTFGAEVYLHSNKRLYFNMGTTGQQFQATISVTIEYTKTTDN